CAMNTTCKTQFDACTANPDCNNLDSCMNTNCNGPVAPPDWNLCKADCYSTYAAGVETLTAYHACIYCDACPIKCAKDAGDKCK
ncbi:MAG: hypothetical protein JXR91_01510, partial [Deltaproteobacteria bacterium]|nr:hypothetical protein [Deltaproteobacteria bacterium]